MEIAQLTPSQLRQAANIKERIEGLQQELESILGGASTPTPGRIKSGWWRETLEKGSIYPVAAGTPP